MKYYRFKARATYYFPKVGKEGTFIYSLYGNYGGFITKIYWWFFTHCKFFRWLFVVDGKEVNSIDLINSVIGNNKIFGVNMGTPGPQQKISILGYDIQNGNKFFAKISTKDAAIELSKNEIMAYQILAGTGLVPKLYDSKVTDHYVYLKCECYFGKHIKDYLPEDKVLCVLNELKKNHYPLDNTNNCGLKTCLAHNDFCLWNMLSVDGDIKLVDWEMAGEFPLGHDLFTYIFQVSFFVWNNLTAKEILQRNMDLIEKYFEGENWKAYLMSFVRYKIVFFSDGQNPYALKRYQELFIVAKEL